MVAFLMLLFTDMWMFALAGFGARLLIQLLVLNRPMRILGGGDLVFLTPFIELVFLFLKFYPSKFLIILIFHSLFL